MLVIENEAKTASHLGQGIAESSLDVDAAANGIGFAVLAVTNVCC